MLDTDLIIIKHKEINMSVYFILSYDIENPQGYEGYVPGVIPLLQKHNAEILVADYEAKSIEGEARGVNVVLRFETEEAAMNMYNDPAYQPLKKLRLDSTCNGTSLLAKQFVFPG
jgi:uncharacterized protein (DUF1330 family)